VTAGAVGDGEARKDQVATKGKVLDEANRVVAGITPDQLGNASPCTEWTVRDVLNHITTGATMFAVCVRDGAIGDEQMVALMTEDALGDDYRGAFRAASADAMAAFQEPGAVDRMVTLPFGTMPAGVAIDIAVFDVAIHTWDLAHASGQPMQLDPDTLATAYALAQAMMPDMRANGVVGDEVDVAPDAPLEDRLAALAGRTP
jgi:uncharacterized protein (TIGR03086 family)